MTIYFDTSALVKLFVVEAKSEQARELAGASEAIATSSITRVEAHSAIALMQRLSKLSKGASTAARRKLATLWPSLVVRPVDDDVIELAVKIIDRRALRAHDSVQLASALSLAEPSDIAFASWDTQLRDAAKVEGLEVLPT